MSAFLGFIQFKFCSTDHHFMPVLDKMNNQVFQIECLRPSFDQSHIVYSERGLELCVLKKVVQYDIRYRIFFQIINHAETITIRFITHITDTFDSLFVDERGCSLDHLRLVDLIRNLCNDDLLLAVVVSYNLCFCANNNSPSSSKESFLYALMSINNPARWKIRSKNNLHQFRNSDLSIIDVSNYRINDFSQIMRRHIGGHAHCNP